MALRRAPARRPQHPLLTRAEGGGGFRPRRAHRRGDPGRPAGPRRRPAGPLSGVPAAGLPVVSQLLGLPAGNLPLVGSLLGPLAGSGNGLPVLGNVLSGSGGLPIGSLRSIGNLLAGLPLGSLPGVAQLLTV